MTKKKDTDKKKKSKPKGKDFFRADMNDEVYIKRLISKKGGVGGIKLG
jgi:hypothetical protein